MSLYLFYREMPGKDKKGNSDVKHSSHSMASSETQEPNNESRLAQALPSEIPAQFRQLLKSSAERLVLESQDSKYCLRNTRGKRFLGMVDKGLTFAFV